MRGEKRIDHSVEPPTRETGETTPVINEPLVNLNEIETGNAAPIADASPTVAINEVVEGAPLAPPLPGEPVTEAVTLNTAAFESIDDALALQDQLDSQFEHGANN